MQLLKTEDGFIVENKISAITCEGLLIASTADGKEYTLTCDVPGADQLTPEKKQAFILRYLMENTVNTDEAFAEARKGEAKAKRKATEREAKKAFFAQMAERRKHGRPNLFQFELDEDEPSPESPRDCFKAECQRKSAENVSSHEKEIEDVFKMLFSALEAEKGGHRHV